jgi:hypothetical protein
MHERRTGSIPALHSFSLSLSGRFFNIVYQTLRGTSMGLESRKTCFLDINWLSWHISEISKMVSESKKTKEL